MNPLVGEPASKLVNHGEESALAALFFAQGEERLARRIAPPRRANDAVGSALSWQAAAA